MDLTHFSLFSCGASQPGADELVFSDSSLVDLCSKILSIKDEEGRSSFDLVSTIRAKRMCGCGRTNLSVGYDGQIYPCHMLHDEKYAKGNLYVDFDKEADLHSAIYDSGPCGKSVDEIEHCKDCSVRYVCGGGCRARSFFATGDVDKEDPYCILMKEYYGKVFSGISG